MRRSQSGFFSLLLFALLAIAAARPVTAQDMPAIMAPLDPSTTAAKPAVPPPAVSAPASPSAEAAVPLAVPVPVAPAKKPQVAAIPHPTAKSTRHVATAAEKKKFAALLKRLAPVHHEAVHHETVRRVIVVAHAPPPSYLPPGTPVEPPGYYPPGPYYQRLVYAGPYGGWGGFHRPYPYYNYP